MRRFVILAIVVLFGGCAKTRPVNQGISNDKNTNFKSTTIKFESEMHDFGIVKSGEILTFSFVFSNTGENNLHFSEAETDCGCVTAKLPEEPIKPGENGIIDVTFNSAGMVGKQLKTIEIKSNSTELKHLIIFASVENELFESIN